MMLSPVPSGLANHLWQSTLFAAGAGLLAPALRRNRAQIRYVLWLVASLKFLVPFSLLMAIGSHLKWPAAVTAQPAVSTAIQQIAQPLLVPDIFNSVSTIPAPAHLGAEILLLIWFCGFLVVLFSWLKHWLRIRIALRNAVSLPFSTPIAILSSPSLLEPGVFGIFRPVLVLPEGIPAHLTAAHLNAILAHELCHIRRRDNLAAVLHMVVEALFWFHPLVWWIGARLVEERERACDEEVLRLGNRPNVYAESILKTCQFYLESPLACASGFTGADLKKRIARIMSQGLAVQLSFRKKLLLGTAGIAALAVPLAVGLTNGTQHGSSTSPTFEVASVKVDKPTAPEFNNSHWRDWPGRLVATDVRLRDVIERAYSVRDYQISGPDWFKTEHYDIQAEWRPSASDAQLPLMLQSFLADRFKLAVHREKKVLPLYELQIAKHGPKLEPVQSDGHNSLTTRRGQWSARDISMSQLAESLSRQTARPVLDKTGLSGFFNFELRFTPDENVPRMPDQPNESATDAAGPSIFTAVQEQLGLKLVPTKGPVEILVIDHVEKIPSEN